MKTAETCCGTDCFPTSEPSQKTDGPLHLSLCVCVGGWVGGWVGGRVCAHVPALPSDRMRAGRTGYAYNIFLNLNAYVCEAFFFTIKYNHTF